MCSSAPDMTGANEAALQQANLSKEQLDWAKQLYTDTQPQRDETQRRQNAVSDQQLAIGDKQMALTDEANQRYKTLFQPVEDKLVGQAQNFDTPERREQAAAEAMNGVDAQSSLAIGGIKRELGDMGTDASSGSAAIALSRAGLAQGAARAAQGNAARNLVETTGHGYLADAANLGRGIATSQGTTASLALNAGNSSANNSVGANSTGMSGAPIMTSGYSGAQSGLAGASNSYLGIGKAQSASAAADNANNAQTGAAVASVAIAI